MATSPSFLLARSRPSSRHLLAALAGGVAGGVVGGVVGGLVKTKWEQAFPPQPRTARRRRTSWVAGGIPYGLGVWATFRLWALPSLDTAPWPAHQPTQEIWGEASGHIFWILSVEGVHWAVRRVLTGGAPEAQPG